VCFDVPGDLGCTIGYCCDAGTHWDTTICDCVAD